MNIDGKKMNKLDDLVLDHYLLWFAFTAVANIQDDIRYRALLRFYTARGLVVE
jgi:hypothetical protein